MATEYFIHFGIDASKAESGGRVVQRSLDDIGKSADKTQTSTQRLQQSLNDVGGASVNTQKVIDKMQLSVLGLERMIIRLAGAISLLELSKVAGDAVLFAAKVEMADRTLQVLATNMGIAAQAARKYRDELKEQNITTSAATIATSNFIRAGLPLERLNEMGKYAQGLATMASGVGNSFVSSSEAVTRFTDAITRMSPLMLHNLGLMTTYRTALQMERQESDKSAASISVKEKRLILFKHAMAEAAAYNNVYSESWGTAARYISSMQRPLEELKRLFGELFQPELLALSRSFYETIDNLGDSINKNKAEWNALRDLIYDFAQSMMFATKVLGVYLAAFGVSKLYEWVAGLVQADRMTRLHSKALEENRLRSIASAEASMASAQAEMSRSASLAASVRAELNLNVASQASLQTKIHSLEIDALSAQTTTAKLALITKEAQAKTLLTAQNKAAATAEIASLEAIALAMGVSEKQLPTYAAARQALTTAKIADTKANNAATAAQIALNDAELAETAIINNLQIAKARQLELEAASAKLKAELVALNAANTAATEANAAAQEALNAALLKVNGTAALTMKTLFSMGTALNVLMTAFVGFQIGKYLSDEFAVVRKAGVWMVDVLETLLADLGHAIKEVKIGFKYMFDREGMDKAMTEADNELEAWKKKHKSFIDEMNKDAEKDPRQKYSTTWNPPGPKPQKEDKVFDPNADKLSKYNEGVKAYNLKVEQDFKEQAKKMEDDYQKLLIDIKRNANKVEISEVRNKFDNLKLTNKEYLDETYRLQKAQDDEELSMLKGKLTRQADLIGATKKQLSEADSHLKDGTTPEARNKAVEARNKIAETLNNLEMERYKIEGEINKEEKQAEERKAKYLSDIESNNRKIQVAMLEQQAVMAQNLGLEEEEVNIRNQIAALTIKDETAALNKARLEQEAFNLWKAQISEKMKIEDALDKLEQTKGTGNFVDDREIKAIERKFKREKELLLASRKEYQLTENEKERLRIMDLQRTVEVEQAKMNAWANTASFYGNILGQLSTMLDSSSKEQFEMIKALNIGQTVMNTAAAIMQAMANLPPPASYVAAAVAAAMGAVQIAKIASTSFGGGSSSVSAGVGAGYSTASSGMSSTGGSLVKEDTSKLWESQTNESLNKLAEAADAAAISLGKMSDNFASIGGFFEEGSRGGFFTGTLDQFTKPLQENKNFTNQSKNPWVQAYNAIFGGGSGWDTKFQGLSLALSEGELLSGTFRRDKKDGGLFGSNKTRTVYGSLDGNSSAFLASFIQDIKSSINLAATKIGLGADYSLANVPNANIRTSGRSPEDISKDLVAWYESAADALSKTIIGLEDLAFIGESAYETLRRVGTAFELFNEKMMLIGGTALERSKENAGAAYLVTDMFGGADKFGDALDQYFESIFDDKTRDALTYAENLREVNGVFMAANLTVPTTKAGFDALVKSLDVTTDYGRTLYHALITTAPAFGEMIDYLQEMKDVAFETLSNESLRTAEVALDLARETADFYKQSATTMRELMSELKGGNLSTLSPEQKYLQARLDFATTANLARTGDRAAIEKLPDIANTFAESSRSYFASNVNYVSDFNNIMQVLSEQATINETLGIEAESQVVLLQDQIDILKALQEQMQLGANANVAAIQQLQTALITNQNSINANLITSDTENTQRLVDAAIQGTGAGGFVTEALNKTNTQALPELVAATTSATNKLITYYTEKTIYENTIADLQSRQLGTQITASNVTDTVMKMVVGNIPKDLNYDVAPIGSPNGAIDIGDALIWMRFAEGLTDEATTQKLQTILNLINADVYTIEDYLADVALAKSRFDNAVTNLSVPGYATGGYPSGWAITGENGPELSYFGSDAKVFTATQTANMLVGAGNDAVVAELEQTNEELQALIRLQSAANQALIEKMTEMEERLAGIERTSRQAVNNQ